MVIRLVVHYAPMAFVVASMDGVEIPTHIVELVVKANVRLAGVMSGPSSPLPCMSKCSNTATKIAAQVMGFIHIMLSLLLHVLLVDLALVEMIVLVKESLLLSLLKPLMRPLEDGLLRQMGHIHGVIVFLESRTLKEPIVILPVGHALLVNCTTVEAPSN